MPSKLFEFLSFSATPSSHEWRSDKEDLSKMFDIATPNPTGSLSGPWFDVTGSGNVTGVRGRNSHLACRVKNLANQTVSQQKICLRPFARYRRILATLQRTKVDAIKICTFKFCTVDKNHIFSVFTRISKCSCTKTFQLWTTKTNFSLTFQFCSQYRCPKL